MQIEETNNHYYTHGKMILSGNVLELFRYWGHAGERASLPLDEDEDAIRGRSLNRARRSLRRKINANAGQWFDAELRRFYKPLFLTLTFAENLTDVPTANKHYHRFIMRLNYNLFHSRKAILKYAVVIEFQERGAVHYHALLFNVPFIPGLVQKIAEIWSHGFVKLNSVDHVDNVGAYVVKYMTKEMSDPRLKGKKTYFTSKNLIPSWVVKDDFMIMDIMGFLDMEPEVVELPHVQYSRFKLGDSFVRHLPLLYQGRKNIKAIPIHQAMAMQAELFGKLKNSDTL